jgi:hypothetical protein
MGQQSIIELEEQIAHHVTMSAKLKLLNEQLTAQQSARRQSIEDQHRKTQIDHVSTSTGSGDASVTLVNALQRHSLENVLLGRAGSCISSERSRNSIP